MTVRVTISRALLGLGSFIQTLPLVVMRPDDLIEFSRQSYSRPSNVESWAEDAIVDSGLTAEELDLLKDVPSRAGELLLLGVGGGREAIPLARMGFRVTGVDFVASMVARARENAARRGVSIEGLVQEISRLEVPAGAYDLVWLSSVTYSSVPGRARRVAMVRRIARALKPGGFFLLQFHRSQAPVQSGKGRFLRRAIAWAAGGNRAYEEGDTLRGNSEFLHSFPSEDLIRSEIEEGGLSIVRFQTDLNPVRCGAVCTKNSETMQSAVA